MTTARISRPVELAALVAAFFVATSFLMAPPAHAQLGGPGDDVGDTIGGATGGATDTVNETVGGATEPVNGTVGGATDTVNETVGGATDTVNETVGGATDTVNETVGGATDTVNETVGGGSGSGEEGSSVTGPAGSKGTTSKSGGGLSTPGAGTGSNGNNNGTTIDGLPVPPGATVVRLPNGSKVVIPSNSGGSIKGEKVSGGGLPDDVLAALNGLTDGFASAGAATPLRTGGSITPEGSTFLDNASRVAADAAKKLAFPTTLALIVLAFLMIHGRVGRRDPKLAEARIDANEDALTFR